jgi:uncharacterized protein YfaS (alpha-2-macroglobulin family)
VSLSYQLSDQPVFGEWIIQIIAQGQIEEASFLVEEYYQTRFEVRNTVNSLVMFLWVVLLVLGLLFVNHLSYSES